MPIQYEKSVADQLAPAAEAFAQGLEKYMKPNHDFQIAMQKAIGGNPQLAQQLADLEYTAPGTLNRMGFGDLGKVIGNIPESEKAQVLRTNRGELVKNDQQKIQLEGEQTGFDLDRLHDTISFLKDPNNKAVTSDMILKKLIGKTSGDLAAQSASTEHETAETKRLNAEQPAVEAEAGEKAAAAKVGRKAYDDALKNLPALKNTDFLGLARDFVAGRADGATMSSIMNTPGAKEVMSKAIQSVEEERQIALRENLTAMHASKDNKDALLTREAFARYQATKGAGTIGAWKTILNDPHQVEEIKKKNPNDLTQDERDILHASNAQDKLQDAQHVNEVRTLNTTIQSAVTNVAKNASKGPAEVQTYVDNLNNVLAQKKDATGKTIIAKFGPKPAVGESTPGFATKHPLATLGLGSDGTGLYYVGEDGKRIKDDAVFSEPKIGVSKLSSDALRAYTEIQAVPQAQRAAALESLKKANPKLYNEVNPVIK